MRGLLIAVAASALAGCVSTQMKTYLGQPIQEAQIAYGAPEQVIDMPDGRRAYQFRYGGGPMLMPGYATTTSTAVGSSVISNTSITPGGVIHSPGCLLTFYARERSGTWFIEAMRAPKELVC